MPLHPATLLLAWGALILAVQRLSPFLLALVVAVFFVLALAGARRRILLLLRRTRWLMLSIFTLFVFFTPGERLPVPLGPLGATWDGLVQAGEHLLHLTLMLSTLALLHERLGTPGMVAGLHALLRPVSGNLRERIVVRLMLVLEEVESSWKAKVWREWLNAEAADGPDRLALAAVRWGAADVLCLTAAAALLGAVWS